MSAPIAVLQRQAGRLVAASLDPCRCPEDNRLCEQGFGCPFTSGSLPLTDDEWAALFSVDDEAFLAAELARGRR